MGATGMKKALLFLLLASLCACTSPYSARGIPEIPGVQANMVDVDQAELVISVNFPRDCEYRRNAILLKSAAVALAHDFDHFEFSSDEETSKVRYTPISLNSDRPIRVYLCRGTCPLMYSADAMSHLLVSKFAHATWETRSANRADEKCLLDSRG